MKKAVFLFFSFILFSCCIEQKEQQENEYRADTNWTFMFYFGADNDLEYFLRNTLRNGVTDKTKKIPQTLELSTNQLILTF